MNIAVIPARGGSKRIPRKNIKLFYGKPIIAYAIEAGINSKYIDRVVVSTDDEEIARIARQYGAEVPFIRSNKNSDDQATLNDVFLEVSSKLSEKGNFCMILPTTPLIQLKTIEEAYELLLERDFDTVRPIVRYSYPIQRSLSMKEDQSISFIDEKYYKYRSQDLTPAFHDAGMFYWIKNGATLSSQNRGAVIVNEMHVQDIDTPIDWKLAELKYSMMQDE